MQNPVQVSFRHMSVSDTIERLCWEEAEKLERYCDRIIGCRIVIEQPHRNHRKGNLFGVRIDLTLPGSEIVINREPPAHQVDEDIYVAVRETFDTARRKLEDYVRRMRGQVKQHMPESRALVAKLMTAEGYGFLHAHDGREIYFHRNSVLHDTFDDLGVGDVVAFHEREGDKGPQASTVTLLERRSSSPAIEGS
ncbi:MAG: HPF/RaiA family ribosome-associated protein [Planctomycetota bacterium]|jgi:ribosomal subunit interface protein